MLAAPAMAPPPAVLTRAASFDIAAFLPPGDQLPTRPRLPRGVFGRRVPPAPEQDEVRPEIAIHGQILTYGQLLDVDKASFATGGIRTAAPILGPLRLAVEGDLGWGAAGLAEVEGVPGSSPGSFTGLESESDADVVGNGWAQYSGQTRLFPGRVEVGIPAGPLGSLTVGQLRNPFGVWDLAPVFQNLVSPAADTRVLGFMLRRLDLGATLGGDLDDFDYTLGALRRAADFASPEEDLTDLVLRIGAHGDWGSAGLSGYLPDRRTFADLSSS
ncbi:MAG: hypothetical protein KGR26_14715, partial [Cyanobacteria bacterium REEB65]|nr:hypothetical protein [Cyanobacteria bacterium REEB65]